MRKVLVFVLSIFLFSVIGQFFLSKAYAEISFTTSPYPICQDNGPYKLIFNGPKDTFVIDQEYTIMIWQPDADINNLNIAISILGWHKATNTTTYESAPISILNEKNRTGTWYYKLWFGQVNTINGPQATNTLLSSGKYTMYPNDTCSIGLPVLEMNSPLQVGKQSNHMADIKVHNINPNSDYLIWFTDGQKFNDGLLKTNTKLNSNVVIADETIGEKTIKTATISVSELNDGPGTRNLCLKHGKTFLGYGEKNCEIFIPIQIVALPPQSAPTPIFSSQLGAPLQESNLFSASEDDLPKTPPPCAKWEDGKCTAVSTGLGIDISTDPQGFVKSIFTLVLGLSGGIALILIIISGYRFMASGGNPEAAKAAGEQLTSAIIGLLFIIFSFVILQIIGVDILQIPGFKP